jgi:antitoxin component YwqK of YwqJK toxin-antitoxin module
MKFVLTATFWVLTMFSLSQPDTLWTVSKANMNNEGSLFLVDSGRTVNGIKVGVWEAYLYSKKGEPRRLYSRRVMVNGVDKIQTYCTYSGPNIYSCQVDSLDENGKYAVSRCFVNDKLLWEQFCEPDARTYAKYYYPNGNVSSKGHLKSVILKNKGRCSSDIITSRKVGIWKYYKENGRRRYFQFWD